MILNILLTLLLVALNGFFVAAEFALVKVRASQIELRAQAGNQLAKIAHHMIGHLDAYLSATQLGITLASLGLGWIGEGVVTEIIIEAMQAMGFGSDPVLAHKIALPISFAVITVLHIVFGELAPKSLAIQRPESTTLAIAIPLRIVYYLLLPFIYVLNGFSNFILRQVGITPMHGSEVHTAEELRLLFEQSAEGGQIGGSQQQLLENVFEFNERMVKQIMVPRTRLVSLDLDSTEDEIFKVVFNEGFTRMPVYRETIDNIVGILYVKDLLVVLRAGEQVNLEKLMRPAYYVPETKKISRLLKDFQRNRNHIAVVSDEFGGTSGIVTIEDIIEELVGEIQDEYDEEVPIVEKVGDFEFKVSPGASIQDANDYLPYPLPEGDDYETVGGYLNMIYGRIPEIGDTVVHGVYEFNVLEKTERNVGSVLLTVTNDKREDIL